MTLEDSVYLLKNKKLYKKISFGGIYTSFNLQCIHRCFDGTNEGLLALFAINELLHNLNWFIDEYNYSKDKQPLSKTWYKDKIKKLRNGNIEIRPKAWNYITNNLNDKEKQIIEKKAAKKALAMLQPGLIKFLETGKLSP